MAFDDFKIYCAVPTLFARLVYACFPDWLMNEHYRVLFLLASE